MKKSFKNIVFICLILLAITFNFSSVLISQAISSVTAETIHANNFLSRNTAKYENINGKTVTVDTFYRDVDEDLNNPNVAQGIMLKQCIDYKKKYPEKEVYATLTSFHLSVVASVCVDSNSSEYGRMKSLYDVEFDDKGYYRVSYLLVEAAKYGINVISVGHIDGAAVLQDGGYKNDINHTYYFNSHMEDDCYVDGKKVKDFMVAKTTDWTSYGDKAGTDMMHLKTCTVSNYIDTNGVEHGSAVWFSSTNLDGIDKYGSNGNDSIQTGVVVSDHEELRRVTYNYTKMLTNYCGQEEVILFRDKVVKMNTEQIKLINSGKGNEIPQDEQIVYLGTENDKVFELYFTAFGGSPENWDTEMNPYCKYLSKLLPSVSGGDYIDFMWNNVKYVSTFPFAKTVEDILQYSFTNNPNLKNKLYIKLYGIDTSKYSNLVEGVNIGHVNINENVYDVHHGKDFQLSYVENGERYYVTCFNSLNFHSGAMFGQSNTVFIVKETKETGNNLYTDFGKLTIPGIDFEAGRIA